MSRDWTKEGVDVYGGVSDTKGEEEVNPVWAKRI
jgi:hypothetical protein